MLGWRAARARCGRALQRRWGSTGGGKASGGEAKGPVGLPPRTPGVARIQRGGEGAKPLEVDSTIARIIGSDWGDRRGQAVSLPMRIYWVVFAVVLANGAYTYFSGKDERFLVDKLREKVDEKVGNVEQPSEFEVVASGDAAAAEQSVGSASTSPPATKTTTKTTAAAQPVSIFSANPSATPSPFFSPAVASRSPAAAPRAQSKEELQARLHHLRARQRSLREAARAAAGHEHEELEHQVRMIDMQKAELKRALKGL